MSVNRSLLVLPAVLGGVLALRFFQDRSLRIRGFKNKVVVITGGSRGLGLALSRQFAQRGAILALCARDSDELDRAREELEQKGARVMTYRCDVSLAREVDRFIGAVIRRFGRIDVLVNNAGIIQVGPVDVIDTRDLAQVMDINFWGTVHATMAALPRMKRGARIVNITSIGGEVAIPHLLSYSAAKFAARGFSEGLRAEVGQKGIRVVTVLPGLMRTGSFIQIIPKGNRKKERAWFSVGAITPLITMNADRAAEKVVRATLKGQSVVTLGVPAKALRLAHALFPGAVTEVMVLVNRLLPAFPASGARLSKRLGRRWIEKYNQKAA